MDQARKNLYPVLRYRDAQAAIQFLCEAFGFERHAVYEAEDGSVEHAQLAHGNGMVMLSTESDERAWGPHAGQGWTYVVVDDADAHYARAKTAGATIVRELEDQDYGSRDYSAKDPEGNIWSFGTYDPAAADAEEETSAAS
ncbi:MAG TPA: VOC family protein [Thermoleophilaceae bacterium]|nr:VOC family protein [Thermoleophilaceae bacterium]